MLFTERAGPIEAFIGGQKRVLADPTDVVSASESGMLGLAEFVWGAITFSRESPPAPRVALAVALVTREEGAKTVPIVRENDGLALTVRNHELTTGQRQEAAALHAALLRAREMVGQGVRIPDRVIAEVTHLLGLRRRVRVIYVAIVDPVTMEPMRAPGRRTVRRAAGQLPHIEDAHVRRVA